MTEEQIKNLIDRKENEILVIKSEYQKSFLEETNPAVKKILVENYTNDLYKLEEEIKELKELLPKTISKNSLIIFSIGIIAVLFYAKRKPK